MGRGIVTIPDKDLALLPRAILEMEIGNHLSSLLSSFTASFSSPQTRTLISIMNGRKVGILHKKSVSFSCVPSSTCSYLNTAYKGGWSSWPVVHFWTTWRGWLNQPDQYLTCIFWLLPKFYRCFWCRIMSVTWIAEIWNLNRKYYVYVLP